MSDSDFDVIAKIRPLKDPEELVIQYAAELCDLPVQDDFLQAIPLLPQLLTEVINTKYDGLSLLREAWEYSSTYLAELFGQESLILMMETFGQYAIAPESQDFMLSLPEIVTVYRGGDSLEAGKNAMSWSLAQEWAAAHAGPPRKSIILKGELDSSDILFFSAMEQEVVVKPGTVRVTEEYDSESGLLSKRY